MPQSLSKIYIHLIFHIKTTSPVIRSEDLDDVHAYIGELVNTTGCVQIRAGGIGDHVHVLFMLSRDNTLSHVVEEIKRNSSRWLRSKDAYYRTFGWQGGYAAFSVSQSVVGKTIEYIDNQREHHKRSSFKDEYIRFLQSYGIEYDERYVFKD
ncbi:transposase [Prevotella sp.]|uniref:transposase n=1 Tax=Prevotella sp. TaxID=59823 RepID=UPI0025D8225E|nr:transposase [Prevotella sp.]